MANNGLLEIGDTYHSTFIFSQEHVNLFADVTGDNNPIHLDSSFAANSIFKRPIIHGFLGGSVFSKVLGTTFPGPGTIYLKQSMTFLKPMFTEETYTARFEVINVNRDKHRATIKTRIVDAQGEEVIVGEALVLNQGKI